VAYDQRLVDRIRRAKRSGVGVGNRQVRRDSVADYRHLLREFDVPDGAEVAYHPCDFDPILSRHQCEGDRVCDLGRHRLSLRPVHGHHHRRVKVGAVEISQRRHHLTHLGQPVAPWDHGHRPSDRGSPLGRPEIIGPLVKLAASRQIPLADHRPPRDRRSHASPTRCTGVRRWVICAPDGLGVGPAILHPG
jgi:hypothetical protein